MLRKLIKGACKRIGGNGVVSPSPAKKDSLKKIRENLTPLDYDHSKKISLLKRLSFYFTTYNYAYSKEFDDIIRYIVSNYDQITKIQCTRNFVEIFFSTDECFEFWNHNKWYAWCSEINTFDLAFYKSIRGRPPFCQLPGEFSKFRPSRKMMIRLAELLYRYGIDF